MKRFMLASSFVLLLLPLACATSKSRVTSVACREISVLDKRLKVLVASDVPFLIELRMAFADPEIPDTFSKMVAQGSKSHAGATFVDSDEFTSVSWSMLRKSHFLFGESSNIDVPPEAWDSAVSLQGVTIPEMLFGLELVKPICETSSFDGSTNTFLIEPVDASLGLRRLSLKIGEAEVARKLWNELEQVTVCKSVATREGCALLSLSP